jgi:hypothetical protein
MRRLAVISPGKRRMFGGWLHVSDEKQGRRLDVGRLQKPNMIPHYQYMQEDNDSLVSFECGGMGPDDRHACRRVEGNRGRIGRPGLRRAPRRKIYHIMILDSQ